MTDVADDTDDTDGTHVRRPRLPRRRVVIVGGTLLAALAVAAVLVFRPVGDSSVRVNDVRVAPTFAIPDLRDQAKTVRLGDASGRPVVLNFWASWCVPCRKEMPAFQAVHAKVGDRVTFIGINNQDSRDDALALLHATGITYQAGFDPQGRVANAYGLYGMPTTVFIAGDGHIVGRRVGEMSQGDLESAIADLFPPR